MTFEVYFRDEIVYFFPWVAEQLGLIRHQIIDSETFWEATALNGFYGLAVLDSQAAREAGIMQ